MHNEPREKKMKIIKIAMGNLFLFIHLPGPSVDRIRRRSVETMSNIPKILTILPLKRIFIKIDFHIYFDLNCGYINSKKCSEALLKTLMIHDEEMITVWHFKFQIQVDVNFR